VSERVYEDYPEFYDLLILLHKFFILCDQVQ
jgi:hypothetical protein